MTTNPPPVDLDRLDALHRAATPGPWEWHFEDASVLAINGPGHLEDHVLWAQVCKACQPGGGRCTAPSDANADAIVALRNAYEPMAAELRALRAEVDALREALREGFGTTLDKLRAALGPHMEDDYRLSAILNGIERLRAVRDAAQGAVFTHPSGGFVEDHQSGACYHERLRAALDAAAGGA